MKKNKYIFLLFICLVSFNNIFSQTPAGKCFHVDYPIWTQSSNPTVYFSCGNNNVLNPDYEITIETWINLYDNSWNQKIVGKVDGNGTTFNNGYCQAIQSGQNYCEIWNPSSNSLSNGGLPKDSVWAHLATTFSAGDSMKVYINGKLVGSKSVSGSTIAGGTSPLIIGVCPWQTYSSFQTFGNIDEVRIWNYAKSIDQINADMHIPLHGDEAGLVAYYNFNETSGDTLHDKTANLNHGVCNVASANYWWWENSYAVVGDDRMYDQTDVTGIWYGKDQTANPFSVTQTGLNMVTDIKAKAYDYVVYGNDADTGTTTNNLAIGAPTNYIRASRIWYVNKGGNVNADMIFNLINSAGGGTQLPTGKPTSHYTLLVRDDTTGNFAPLASADYTNGVGIKFSNVNLQNKYFTIGVGDAAWASIHENSGIQREIRVFPNPVTSNLNIKNILNSDISISLYDMFGKQVYDKSTDSFSTSIDMTGFSDGIYVVKIIKGNEIFNDKIILQKK